MRHITRYIIRDFKDVAQAKAIFKSLKTDGFDDPTEDYVNFDTITQPDNCWVVIDDELLIQGKLSSMNVEIPRIPATLYCILKNI